ncbi:MAG: hypothetical protein JSS27_15980 [Planctomycetes bacterium]|nr:hypothetical protein [Planctomycetota bacterium]
MSLASSPSSTEVSDRTPRPRRWPSLASLRNWLTLLEVLSVGWLVLHLLGAVWATLLLWSALLVAAHVAGNAFGTRLKDRHERSSDDGPQPSATAGIRFAPVTRLGSRRPLGWSVLLGVGLGATLGATAGLLALWLLYEDALGYGGLVVGGASATALGGLLGFLSSTFLNTTLRALGEASAMSRVPHSLGE